MTDRRAILVLIAGSLAAAAGCDNGPEPKVTANLFKKAEVFEAMKKVMNAFNALGEHVTECDVIAVQDSFDDLRLALVKLENEIGYRTDSDGNDEGR
jgi:hypothetical protein